MLIIYADGACRGNPGEMAIRVSIQRPKGRELETVSEARGHGTNNIAEYQAAIEGMKRAKNHGDDQIELRLDSEFVVKQLNGEYRVNDVKMKPLWAEASGLLATFKKAKVVHVRREKNKRADELANLALDGAKSVLDDAESELVERILGVFRDKPIDPSRRWLVLKEVERLLKDE